VSISSGLAGAAFIQSLAWVTHLHQDHPWLIAFLPVAGIAIVWITTRYAGTSARGTNLLINAVHNDSIQIPFRLAPWIFGTTLLTHLTGGSAGREGTAIQLGGGIAAGIARSLQLAPHRTRIILLTGMAAGFGAVFGTPCAAALFAIECPRPTKPDWRPLPLCLASAWLAHGICSLSGGHHTVFNLSLPDHPSPTLGPFPLSWLLASAIAGIGFGLVARLFILAGQFAARSFTRIPSPWLRPCIGAFLVICLSQLLGTRAYLGLGVHPVDPGNPSILTALAPSSPASIGPIDWLWKLLFTVITLGSGFKGGEVTPLFFMGACAGHVMAPWLGVPFPLLAAVGMAAVFSGASHARLACTVMAVELFGATILPYAGLACFIAPWLVGKTGIYEAQQRGDVPIPH
jgi:H+/Cl- antiporter ClcA